MSLPLTRNRTYTAGVQIPSGDMNDLQDYLSRLYTGVRSVKALVVDGTGGNTVAPQSGTIQASGHISVGGASPTFTAGAGAGTGPTIIAVGNDQCGTIQVQIGSSPTAASALITVTYAVPFLGLTGDGPIPMIFPANNNAGLIPTTNGIFLSRTGSGGVTGFVINIAVGALTATSQYKWNYIVMGT